MPDFVLQDDQEVVVALEPADAANNPIPAGFDAGTVTAVSSVPTALEVVVSADQTSYTATAVGPEETGVTVTVNGAVDGVAAPNPSVLTFDITASPLTSINQTPGTPTVKPAPAAPAAPATPAAPASVPSAPAGAADPNPAPPSTPAPPAG
jgi:hypothetical protein